MRTVITVRHLALLVAGLCGLAGTAGAQAAPASTSDQAQRGEQVYARCLACHALATDRVGPRHCGLLGRKAGTVAGAAYSPAMKRSGLVWDARTLDRFLAAPMRVVPGTTMTYDGVRDPQDRADLIAYLRAAGQDPQACPAR